MTMIWSIYFKCVLVTATLNYESDTSSLDNQVQENTCCECGTCSIIKVRRALNNMIWTDMSAMEVVKTLCAGISS
jgi:ferredoxin-like protein FixX